ncbi:helicase C-terminal domain-containing protein [Paenibacillus sp. JX-17]|uniref:Helicase C-terminal domain-containing protein n=1 Tax=Paenibacillus lacisoli TaxID=3064525 RepID=A0ABT9CCL6_9BACL|nr:helicase C-terminal domain-containing protein [Paenibacillus sp. JX-17]MDO7906399.1 helicase C-terminal domain-containing protein [Paenibacillus sp. JX-17]
MTYTIQISVRPLVEYVYRSGSIQAGFRTNSSMQEGTRIHQRIQQTYGEQDQRELLLKAELVYEELIFAIEGRCDGLIDRDGELMVDEIKSTALSLDSLENGYEVHWAQAVIYGYMIARERQQSVMHIQLTYVQVNSGEERRLQRTMDYNQLEDYVHQILKAYAPYARLMQEHERRRTESLAGLQFPFPSYRAGQRHLAGAVYKTVAEGQQLLAQAPTGIGKTISTLFPVMKAMENGDVRRIYYLTARTTTRTAAEEAFSLMASQGMHAHVVTLTAKDKICFKEEQGCDSGECSMCEGYYDRINDALLDLLGHETLITRSVIEQYARRHQVCPFEFSLDAAYAADAVICDYNYIFDPRISLKRIPEAVRSRSVLLVDEAHNLVDRAREMFSSELSKSQFLNLKRSFKTLNPAVAQTAGAINAHMLDLRKQSSDVGFSLWEGAPAALLELLEPFTAAAEEELLHPHEAGAEYAELLDTYFMAQNFQRIARLYDERYVTYAEASRSELRLKMLCRDPSQLLRQAAQGFRSTVFFSATLSPLHYYRDMLGATEDDYTLQVASPFHKEQLDVRLMPLSIRYRDRERSKGPIARMLLGLAEENGGNLLVFLPSHAYLREVYEAFVLLQPDADILVQSGQMSEEERDAFLAAFQPEPAQPLIGFAVLGGIFAEGVDLPGNRLNGVVIVGVGMPQIGVERNILRDYFSDTGRSGFNYAYVYPGMNKVQQAGGRLIRTETDTGVLVLVDDRFLQLPYAQLLPEAWQEYTLLTAGIRSDDDELEQAIDLNADL